MSEFRLAGPTGSWREREGSIIKATPQAQQRLLDLQEVDSALAQLRHRRQTLPDHQRFLALSADHDLVGSDLVSAETQVSDLELALQKAEADLVPVRQRRERDQQRIADGSVGDPKALSTMIDEVEHLTRRIGTLEDIELEVMQQHEDAVGVRDALQRRIATLEDEIATVRAERDARAAEIDAEARDHQSSRAALVVELPDDLLALYDKLRAGHGGVGAAALIQRRCTGCRLEANAADLRDYAASTTDTVLRCEECGRILVRTESSGL